MNMTDNEKMIEYIDDIITECTGRMGPKAHKICCEIARDNEELLDFLRHYKIGNYTGFVGSNNYYHGHFINILKHLKSLRDKKKCEGLEVVAKNLNMDVDLVHLIYCVLFDCDLIGYGINLHGSWITDKGVDCLNPEFTDIFLQRLIKEWGEEHAYYDHSDKA